MNANNNDAAHRFAGPDGSEPVDWEQLKAKFTEWKDQVMQSLQAKFSTGEISAEELKTRADEAMHMIQDRWKDLEQNYGDYAKRLAQKIEQHPLAAAAIALGVGFVAAKLLSRK